MYTLHWLGPLRGLLGDHSGPHNFNSKGNIMTTQTNALSDLLAGTTTPEVAAKPDTTVNKYINCKSGAFELAVRIYNTPAQRGINATQKAIQQALADADPEVVMALIAKQGIEVVSVNSAKGKADTDTLAEFNAALALVTPVVA